VPAGAKGGAKDNPLKIDLQNPRAIQEALRMGIRVDAVEHPRPDLAWVLIRGRNTDGTEYRFSECWIKKGDHWLQRTPPGEAELALLPSGWARPLQDVETWSEKMVLALANAAQQPKRSASSSAAANARGTAFTPAPAGVACGLTHTCR
jgi:hypothetical protein